MKWSMLATIVSLGTLSFYAYGVPNFPLTPKILIDCTQPKPECGVISGDRSIAAMSSDGLHMVTYMPEYADGLLQDLRIWLYERSSSGWSSRAFKLSFSGLAQKRVKTLTPSRDAKRVVIHTYYEVNNRERVSAWVADFSQEDMSASLKKYPDSFQTPFYTLSTDTFNENLLTRLLSGRTDYSCVEPYCQYGFLVVANADNQLIGSGRGEARIIHADNYIATTFLTNIVTGDYFVVSSPQNLNIFKLADGTLSASIPRDQIWSGQTNYENDIYVSAANKLLKFVGKDGFVRQVDLTTGKIVKKAKIENFHNLPETPLVLKFLLDRMDVWIWDESSKGYAKKLYNLSTGKLLLDVPPGMMDIDKNDFSSTAQFLIRKTRPQNFGDYDASLINTRTGEILLSGRQSSFGTNFSFSFINKYGDIFSSFLRADRTGGFSVYELPK